MNIILTGFMGTGKTAVGRRLARRLGWRFVDVDQLIEASAGMPVRRIFTQRGEAVFRRLERRVINRVIRNREQVIATGGGAFVDSRNRARLRVSGPVICLTARPGAILSRVKPRLGERPLLRGGTPLARIKALLRDRAAAYAQADTTIDTSDLTVEEVVERVWQQLSPCLGARWNQLLTRASRMAGRYCGKYVVVVNNRIIGCGETQLAAYRKAGLARPLPARGVASGEAGIYYIPLPEESLTAF